MIPAKDRHPGYPETLDELKFYFPNSESCAAYLAALRWQGPDGFHCARCGASKYWPAGDRRECAECGTQYSATSGTSFHMSKVSLPHWFQAFWWLVTHKGIPSLKELRKILRARNFEAARPLLAKMSAAIAFRDGVRGCTEVYHYEVAGHEIIMGARPVAGGKHEVRLHWFEKAGIMPLAKYIRSRLHFEGEVFDTRPVDSPQAQGTAAGSTSGGEPLAAPFPRAQLFLSLKHRLLASPSLTPPQLQLVLNLHAFQESLKDLRAGELWRKALLFALRPVRGRGLPPWPPPPDQWP
jgi:hypothetical protein